MILSTHISHNNYATIAEWPEAEKLPFKGACGVIGPEVEANWITKILDKYGNFERLLSNHNRELAVSRLTDQMGFNLAAAQVWVNRYYLPEA